MTPTTVSRQTERLVWVGVGLTVALVLLAFALAALRMQARASKPLPIYGQVADFSLTNQMGQPVSLAELRGHVWVADIIFTRCAGPCPRMTRQMKELQQSLPASSSARLVTLTTDPEFDSAPVLKTYAERFGADPKRWLFLTGTKKEIGRLAIDSLKLTALEKPASERESPADLFVHSTIFVLIDQQGQLRAVYETSSEAAGWEPVKARLLAAVRRLEREP